MNSNFAIGYKMVVLKKQSYTYPGFLSGNYLSFHMPLEVKFAKAEVESSQDSGVFKGAKARTKLSNIAPKDEKLRQGVERLDFY